MTQALEPRHEYDRENEIQHRLAVQRDLAQTHMRGQDLDLGHGEDPYRLIFSSAAGFRLAMGLNDQNQFTLVGIDDGEEVSEFIVWQSVAGRPESLSDLDQVASETIVSIQGSVDQNTSGIEQLALAGAGRDQSIAQLETNLTASVAAQGVINGGFVTDISNRATNVRVDTVETNASQAIAASETLLRSEYQTGDNALLAEVNDRVTTATFNSQVATLAAADAAGVSSQQVLEARTVGRNPNLIVNSTGRSGLDGWSQFGTGWFTSDDPALGNFFANATAGQTTLFSSRFRCADGQTQTFGLNVGGAGFSESSAFIRYYNSAGTEVGLSGFYPFSPDTSYPRLTFSFTAPAGAVEAELNFGGTIDSGGFILGYRVKAEGGSLETQWADDAQDALLARAVGSNTATVSTQAAAIASIDGQLSAFYGIAVSAGGVASLQLIADGSPLGSVIELSASQIRLNGNVIVNGTITRNGLEVGAATNSGGFSNDGPINLSAGSWTTVGTVTLPAVGGTVFVSGSCDLEAILQQSTSQPPPNASVRITRNGAPIRTRRVLSGSLSRAQNGATVSWSLMAAADIEDLDNPGAGNRTYRIEVLVNGGGGTITVSNRSLVAMELRR